VGDKIQWMVSRQVQSAEIKLTPPDLGPMEIKLSIKNDQTSVQFVASHAATREALEAAIPRLREMFGEIQLNLANVDVSQQQANGSQTGDDNASATADGYENGSGGSEAGITSAEGLATQQGSGLLDTYA
jgi:flagellar hook-length control protein FliK